MRAGSDGDHRCPASVFVEAWPNHNRKCAMKPSYIDPELCIRHTDGETNSAMTKHVDDLKITGEPEYVKNILSALQAVFGELKIEWYAFTNCGVRHIQSKVTFQITLDETEYAANLRFISHAQLTGAKT